MCNGIDLIIKEGVSRRIFNDEFGDPEDLNPKDKKLYYQLVGEYDQGAVFYGKISYTDIDGTHKEQKFKSWVNVGGGYGSAVDLSSTYNTYLNADSANYKLSVPVSQGIKPQDFDRFSLIFASSQSSKYFFKLSFSYNSKQIDIPLTFCLDYFNSPFTSSRARKGKVIYR